MVPLKLLVVDDSKLFRRVICRIFETDENTQVAGEASDGQEALKMISEVKPDVITMDIIMPDMDGLTALKHIMIKTPTPTLMLSNVTEEGADVTFDSLKYGAVDFIQKPSSLKDLDMEEQRKRIIRKVKLASKVQAAEIQYLRTNNKDREAGPEKINCDYMFAVGTSEGGYGALLKIVPQLTRDIPAAFIIVLSATSEHVSAFARYLDKYSPIRVERARDGVPIEGGGCYISSADEYVTVNPENGNFILQVSSAPFPERGGAIDMLMFSVADAMRENSGGIILSGSGEDGIEGMGEILRLGGSTIVQDPRSCFSKEMVQKIIEKYKIDIIASELEMAEAINSRFG
ncbi:MAG: response regulator [Deltaproteobacteria bacterium]|nr:response regulator [Deltaproteobacteria bacterium]